MPALASSLQPQASSLSSDVDCSVLPNKRRGPLLPVQCARLARGWTPERIQQAIEAGEFMWVWDISAGKGEQRELRFWTREIIAPETAILLSPDSVVSLLLGTRDFWSVAALVEFLLCTRPLVHDLFDGRHLQRQVRDGLMGADRAALRKFLHARLLTS